MNSNILDPLSKNMHLVILGLFAYILLCHVNDDDYTTMVILTASTCMAICYLKKNQNVVGQTNVEGLENPAQPKRETGSGIIRQLPASMGAYDGLCLQTGNKENWMKSPDDTALIPDNALFSYLSSQGPLKPVFTDNTALRGPPVDGQEGSPKKMFMFANNRSSPNCCPGTYSTSTGCVCTTKGQRDFIASRGNQGAANLQDI